MVSEVSQTKRNTACYHLYYDISSKINEHNSGNRLTDIKNQQLPVGSRKGEEAE